MKLPAKLLILPAPKDGFRFTARFYGPSTSLIDGSYDMPGVVRVE